MILSNLVKTKRDKLGLSLRAAGEKAGLSQASVHNIEHGRDRDLKLSTLLGLSKALRVGRRTVFEAAVETYEALPEVIDYMKGDTSG